MKNSVSSKLPLILVIFLVIAIAVATVLENRYGTHYALQHVYGAWWFVCLWAMLALAGCWLMYKRKMWKQPSVMLLHLSFLVILLGALATYLTSHKGMVHLREGETCRTYWVKNEQGLYTLTEDMPFYLALKKFQILYDADGTTPADYVSHVLIATREGKEETTISMNNIARVKGFRIYQTSFDDDLGGSVFTISYDPWGTAITYAGYLLLAISMIWVSISRSQKSKGPSPQPSPKWEGVYDLSARRMFNVQWGTILLTFCGIAMASYMVIAICRSPLVPILRSPFLVVHVGTIMLSYILLVVSILRREVLRPAVFLLATGIFLGAVWANVSWGTYWSWDPKESWALITLLVYSVPLHSKSLPWFNSMRNYRIYSLLAFACLLMTYFGVNFLLGGMHSYAG
jgi:ABC-type transport system involved in cytochrome c biogenesis permease subunit